MLLLIDLKMIQIQDNYFISHSDLLQIFTYNIFTRLIPLFMMLTIMCHYFGLKYGKLTFVNSKLILSEESETKVSNFIYML